RREEEGRHRGPQDPPQVHVAPHGRGRGRPDHHRPGRVRRDASGFEGGGARARGDAGVRAGEDGRASALSTRASPQAMAADTRSRPRPAPAQPGATQHAFQKPCTARRESIMRRWKSVLLVPLLGLASLQALACYTVYDRGNRVMWQGDKPPVDMSRPLGETVPARFPGGQLVFDDSPVCPVVSSVAIGNGGFVSTTSSPLLTDEKTA